MKEFRIVQEPYEFTDQSSGKLVKGSNSYLEVPVSATLSERIKLVTEKSHLKQQILDSLTGKVLVVK